MTLADHYGIAPTRARKLVSVEDIPIDERYELNLWNEVKAEVAREMEADQRENADRKKEWSQRQAMPEGLKMKGQTEGDEDDEDIE